LSYPASSIISSPVSRSSGCSWAQRRCHPLTTRPLRRSGGLRLGFLKDAVVGASEDGGDHCSVYGPVPFVSRVRRSTRVRWRRWRWAGGADGVHRRWELDGAGAMEVNPRFLFFRFPFFLFLKYFDSLN
jgi:hypothetical protein